MSTETEKLILALQNDLKTLSLETKRKHGFVKDACEEAIVKIRSAGDGGQKNAMSYITNQALYPVLQGCDTKDPKIVKHCLHSVQKLITGGYVDAKGARSIYDTAVALLEGGLEDIKVLQTVTLLLTTNETVRGDLLARNLVLCFRLCCSKDLTTAHAAGATVRQLVSLVFERIPKGEGEGPLEVLGPEAEDAYHLLEDLILLVNGEQPKWLLGISEMFRAFGLELLETLLARFPFVFHQYPAFGILLRERVCAMVIKLFPPNAKFIRGSHQGESSGGGDSGFYATSVRLLRILDVLIRVYYSLLVTECEIFLSLLVRFLDPEKAVWQRCLALEVLHKLVASPHHLARFCRAYDLKPQATNICKDIVNALGAYVHSVFANPNLLPLMTSASSGQGGLNNGHGGHGGMSSEGSSPSAGFYIRGSLLPLVQLYQPSTPKPQLLELTEKLEPPSLGTCESYGLALSFATLSDFVLSLNQIAKEVEGQSEGQGGHDADPEVLKELISSSWPGLLAALNLFLEASIDERVTEVICERLMDLAVLSGRVGLNQCRESTVLSLCVAALPPHYGYAVLKGRMGHGDQGEGHENAFPPHPLPSSSDLDPAREQVVVVGTSVVPSLALPPSLQSTPAMLTKKNLVVTHWVLRLALEAGPVLLTSWLALLTTLEHLAWVCGVTPKSSADFINSHSQVSSKLSSSITNVCGGESGYGSSGSGHQQGHGHHSTITAGVSELSVSAGKRAGVMGAVVDFVSCLSSGVLRVMETSSTLDDVSLHHVINALTTLSMEAMEIAYSNREPSLFAVGKLLEVGLVNLGRVEIYWRPLTNHLLEVCRHPHLRMREWGSEALTFLVRSALLHEDNEKATALLLAPLCELSSVPHKDVRAKQLTALSQVLHSKGDCLGRSWPLALNILGYLNENQSEGLVRSAFQCLQLVVTDFLPVLPPASLPATVDTVAKFARQKEELNVALSAVGLMWNIADFLYQNREKILDNLPADASVFPSFPGIGTNGEVPEVDRLWLGIYGRLGELCTDERPALRKSAGQTLFSTITAHSGVLGEGSWESVFWVVLFPLLEQVEGAWRSASSEKVDGAGKSSLLIHHSRNTEEKQWAETEVLVLGGISRIFSTKRALLLEGKKMDFGKGWSFFLSFLSKAASSPNEEVSLAALKAFQEALLTPVGAGVKVPEEVWTRSWATYMDIGEKVITSPQGKGPSPTTLTQQYLSTYVQIFQALFLPLKGRLVGGTISGGTSGGGLERLHEIFARSLVLPLTSEGASSILFSSSDSGMTPLQDQVLLSYDLILQEAGNDPALKPLLPPLILQLIDFGAYAVRNSTSAKGIPLEGVVPNSQEFGIRCLKQSVSILGSVCREKTDFFPDALAKFRPILASRFLNSEGAWRECALQFFLAVPLMVDQGPRDPRFWDELAACAQEFLFFSGSGEWRSRKGWKDEKMDVRMVALLKDLVFLSKDSAQDPHFLTQVVKIFHQGSSINEYEGISVAEREEFVRFCFSSLLEFVLKGPSSLSAMVDLEGSSCPPGGKGPQGKTLAVLALLQRFQNIILNYKEYVNHNSHITIQRHRLAEMNFVLRATTSLIENLKTADPNRSGTWEAILGIYPDLVGIVGLRGVDASISGALRDALLSYKDLLRPPK